MEDLKRRSEDISHLEKRIQFWQKALIEMQTELELIKSTLDVNKKV